MGGIALGDKSKDELELKLTADTGEGIEVTDSVYISESFWFAVAKEAGWVGEVRTELVAKCVRAAMIERDRILESMGFSATKSVEALQRAIIVAALECYEKERLNAEICSLCGKLTTEYCSTLACRDCHVSLTLEECQAGKTGL